LTLIHTCKRVEKKKRKEKISKRTTTTKEFIYVVGPTRLIIKKTKQKAM
jgi:hypothetical protein